ncbi:formate dehydrogenase accessory sulfurtransferase FdhD [Salisediminibacterium beveridgei]|uniref:Formate dehydrogenase chain D n=1 Tax=Salisediminibacterium beveridgei TaxID=632773 RepID=A0A1D7QS99_9BACI|nr:formate dehydrogenase accessory sulfurtransferase FdhD [Salisediminibacterium beveridgei]AOM81863.1 Formate dehydrogenase chain D [Salisediminibacterium beveridgei]
MDRKSFPDEYPVQLIVNGRELATFQLSLTGMEDWAIGYLYSEGLIDGMDDLEHLRVNEDQGRIDVEVSDEREDWMFSDRKKHYTAGCGKGVTFFSMSDVREFPKVRSNAVTTLRAMLKQMAEFGKRTPLYDATGGMHGACLYGHGGDMVVYEDIGRHNAVDKVLGYAVRHDLRAEDLILLTSGRISYEMLAKTAKFGIGVIGSRTTPTLQAVQVANYLGVEVVAYMRGRHAEVCTGHGRVTHDLKQETH